MNIHIAIKNKSSFACSCFLSKRLVSMFGRGFKMIYRSFVTSAESWDIKEGEKKCINGIEMDIFQSRKNSSRFENLGREYY